MRRSRGLCLKCANFGTTVTPECFRRRPRLRIESCGAFSPGRGPAYGATTKALRIAVEKHIGRTLQLGEYIHHLNGNHFDNRAENLIVCDTAYHAFLHCQMRGGLASHDITRSPQGWDAGHARAQALNDAMTRFLIRENTIAGIAYRPKLDQLIAQKGGTL
jgi:hypothetical protein